MTIIKGLLLVSSVLLGYNLNAQKIDDIKFSQRYTLEDVKNIYLSKKIEKIVKTSDKEYEIVISLITEVGIGKIKIELENYENDKGGFVKSFYCNNVTKELSLKYLSNALNSSPPPLIGLEEECNFSVPNLNSNINRNFAHYIWRTHLTTFQKKYFELFLTPTEGINTFDYSFSFQYTDNPTRLKKQEEQEIGTYSAVQIKCKTLKHISAQ